MADANVRLIQSLYEAFGRGDAATVLGAFDPDIVWHEAENIVYADRSPYIGPQQVAEGVFGRIMTQWDGFTVTPEQYIAAGEHVVATGRYRGIYKATGVPVNAQFAHVWKLRDGRAVALQQYADTLQFARAVRGSAAGA